MKTRSIRKAIVSCRRNSVLVAVCPAALLLAGCGGDSSPSGGSQPQTFSIGGTASGHTGELRLREGTSGDEVRIASSGPNPSPFTFGTALPMGATYNVSVVSAPSGQDCTVDHGSGTVGSSNVTNVTVTCTTQRFSIGGLVHGLNGSIQIQESAGETLTVTSTGADTAFTFPTQIPFGHSYSVSLVGFPPNQACTISNASGQVQGTVSNINILCNPRALFLIGGTASGLNGRAVLRESRGEERIITGTGSDVSFVFEQGLAAGVPYSVTLTEAPTGQICTLTNASGTMPEADVTSILLTCTDRSPPPPVGVFTLAGQITGLKGQIQLQEAIGGLLTLTANGAFTFGNLLPEQTKYQVNIAALPAGQDCFVANATGSTADGDVTNVLVTCKDRTVDTGAVHVLSLSPAHGPAGTRVTLTGSGFSAVPAENTVRLNNAVVPVISATATGLVVEVPAQAGSGRFVLQVGSSTAASPLFTYDFISSVSTLAGSGVGADDGVGTAARFRSPSGLAIHNGLLYIADTGNNRIRTATLPGGAVSTLVGSTEGDSDGTGALIHFSGPTGLAFSGDNLLVTDTGNNKVKTISPQLIAQTTLAADLISPWGISASGTSLFVVDPGHRRVVVSDSAGARTFATGFDLPRWIACNIVSDQNAGRILQLDSTGAVSTLAGGTGGLAFQDGFAEDARFNSPLGVDCDSEGKVFVVDNGNKRIRMITPSGVVVTLAGQIRPGNQDGEGAEAQFASPQAVVVGTDGTIYISDAINNNIRVLTWR